MSADTTAARLLLVGLGPTTMNAFDGLVERTDVVAMIRDVDDATTARARTVGVPVLADTTVRAVRAAVEQLRPDAVVVSSFNRVLPEDLISRCPFVNVHYAPLPRGRGRAPVNWAMINGDDHVTISIHHLVPALDAGGILYQDHVPIRPESTATTLYEELNELQRRHIADAALAAIAGDPGRTQDETAATYFCTRVPDDGEIDWSDTTARLDRLVRALQDPFPAAYTWLGLRRLHVDWATPVHDAPAYEGRIPGRVVRVDRPNGHVDVLTGDGVLRLHRVRLDDDEPTDAANVVQSVRARLGLTTAELVEAIRRQQA